MYKKFLNIISSKYLWIVLGLIVSFSIVINFYPAELYFFPMSNVDSLAHWTYVKRLIDSGLSVTFNLTSRQSFYPPLFHLLSYAIYSLVAIFGIHLTVAQIISYAWIFLSAIIWPLSFSYYIKCCLYYCDIKMKSYWYFAAIVLSQSFATFPFALLQVGTVYAYFTSCVLLPILLGLTIMLLKNYKNKHLLLFLICIIAIILAQPRVLFLYFVLILPFLVYKMITLHKTQKNLYNKIIIALSFVFILLSVLLVIFVVLHLRSDLLFNPSKWFSSKEVKTNALYALICFLMSSMQFSNGILLMPNMLISIIFLALIVYFLTLCVKKKLLAFELCLIIDYLLVGVIYVIMSAFSGTFANIISAPWYKEVDRLYVAIPIIVIPMLFLIYSRFISQSYLKSKTNVLSNIIKGIKKYQTAFVLLFVISASIIHYIPNISPSQWVEQYIQIHNFDNQKAKSLFNLAKYKAMDEVSAYTNSNSVIIANPYNGSPFLYPLFNRKMLYDETNLDFKKNHLQRNVFDAFKSNDSISFNDYICKKNSFDRNNVFFLDLGKSFTSAYQGTKTFTYFEAENIVQYVKYGNLVKVVDLSNSWKLYKVNC